MFGTYIILKLTQVPSLWMFSAQFQRKQFHFPVLSLNTEPFPQATFCQHHTNKSPGGKVFLCDSLWTQPRISTRLLPRNSVPVIWVSAKPCLQQALLSQTQYQLKDLRSVPTCCLPTHQRAFLEVCTQCVIFFSGSQVQDMVLLWPVISM